MVVLKFFVDVSDKVVPPDFKKNAFLTSFLASAGTLGLESR